MPSNEGNVSPLPHQKIIIKKKKTKKRKRKESRKRIDSRVGQTFCHLINGKRELLVFC